MDFFDVVGTQRAMRRLKPDPIPASAIRTMLDAAICAPSGGNRQGWSFIVVRDPALRAKIGALYRESFAELVTKVPAYQQAASAPADSAERRMVASAQHLADHMAEAPVLILACLATDGVRPGLTSGASIYPAVQNILLAARALGIGSTLTTVHHRFRHAEIKKILGVPDDVEVAALIPLGYPEGSFGRPPRRPAIEVTYADRWGAPLRD
jgi:nitroreductase